MDYDCRAVQSPILGKQWQEWIQKIDYVNENGMGKFIDVLTRISIPFMAAIDEVLARNWEARHLLGDECAMGMMFYYAIRLHYCLESAKDRIAGVGDPAGTVSGILSSPILPPPHHARG